MLEWLMLHIYTHTYINYICHITLVQSRLNLRQFKGNADNMISIILNNNYLTVADKITDGLSDGK